MIPLTVWAWVLAVLAAVDVLLLASCAGFLLWRYLRRYRPVMLLVDAVVHGDLDKARFLLAAVRGAGHRSLVAMARPSLESASIPRARGRFLLAYLASYPTASLGTMLLVTVTCGTGALLPFLVAAAGHADAVTSATVLGLAPPAAAVTLFRVGIAESLAAASLACALILFAHRSDPGSPAARRKVVSRLKEVEPAE